jgi:hypothetical protein
MTRKYVPAVCDLCATDIESEMKYGFDVTQKNGVRGTFVKCSNSADMCHPCFIKICKNGFKPIWIKGVKNPNTGIWDWNDLEIQSKF